MGSESSKKSQSTDAFITNPQFKSVKMVTLENKRVIENYLGGVEKKQYDNWVQRVEKKKILKDQFLLLPLKYDFSSDGLCSSNGIATINYPDYPHLLSDQIQDRKVKNQPFDEDQFWYLLFAVSHAKVNIRPNEKLGDVCPQNIFINDQGVIKVANVLSWPGARTNFQKAYEDQKSYLAPEEVQKLGQVSRNEDGEAEMFSIGLTMLSAASLEDLTYLYDIKLHKFDEGQFNAKLDEFQMNQKYSEILRSTISNLCQIDPKKRMSSDELWMLLESKEDQIKNREILVIDNAPQKLHQQFSALQSKLPILLKSVEQVEKHQPQILKTNMKYESANRYVTQVGMPK